MTDSRARPDSADSPRLPSVSAEIIFLVDVSASMLTNGKIQSLNVAAEESLPLMRQSAAATPGLDLSVRALAFGSDFDWLVETPAPIDNFVWSPARAERKSLSELGLALSAVVGALDDQGEGLRKVSNLILLSDGMPTDTRDPSFRDALHTLNNHPRGRSGARIAVGIGEDAHAETLKSFVEATGGSVLTAQTPQQLASQIQLAGATVISGASESIW